MNRLTIAVVASAAALVASTARADTRVRMGVSVGVPVYSAAPVIVTAPAPTVVYSAPPSVMYAPPAVIVSAPRGYWKEVQVKSWVPERWLVRTNRWGRAERYCEPGYYVYRTERVWVDARPDHRHVYAYGYDAHRHHHHHR